MPFRPLANAVPDQVRDSAEAIRAVLARPHVRPIAVTSLVARLPKGMVPLATVLLLHQITGSYAIAGISAALVAVGDAASTPVQGRLVDRLGRGRVLIPTAAVHVVSVAAVLVLARAGAPASAVAACACVAGIGLPPVSGSIKAVWPQLVGQDQLPAAYTVESLVQQVVFLSGPLLVAGLATAYGPAAALASSAALVAVGTTSFVATAARAASARGLRHQRAHGAWRVPVVRILVCGTALQSLTFGALPVGLAAVTAIAGRPSLAGVLLATLTIGGVVGTFGPVTATGKRRYVRLVSGFAAALIPVAVLSAEPTPTALIGIGMALAAAGLFVTPMAAASYVLIEQATTPAHRTEAFAWLSAAQASGNAAGAALAGVLISNVGQAVALGTLPVAVGLAALIGRLGLPSETMTTACNAGQ
jgi:predicted MFS family arabinose efflux permease